MRFQQISSVDPSEILAAAQSIKNGDIGVMPTETVYGLAADANNPEAVKKIFAAKGRPPENPLIAHVASIEQAREVVRNWDQQAERLATAFWPGPLSLILPRNPDKICAQAAAGLDSVAVRMPRHPVALSLIESAQRPLCAPSANRFMHISATCLADLDPEIEHSSSFLLDGGPCEIGIESTVVSLLESNWIILRKGAISEAEISQVLGKSAGTSPKGEGLHESKEHRAPGQYRRHYAPDVPVYLVHRASAPYSLLFDRKKKVDSQIEMPNEPGPYASTLYAALHALEREHPAYIEIENPPEETSWDAVWDRLTRCASKE